MRFVTTVFVIALISYVHSARILGLFAHTGKSHHMVFEPLLKKLAERGHQVTVASFFPLKTPIANYTDISLQSISKIGLESFDIGLMKKPGLITRIPIVGDVIKVFTAPTTIPNITNICDKVAIWPPLVKALKKPYDVVLVETFISDCMLGLLHVNGIKVPVIGLSSTSALPWANSGVGLSDNPSFSPIGVTTLSEHMSFRERMLNTLLYIMFYWLKLYIQENERMIIEKHYSMAVPLNELSLNMTLILVNTFHPLNGVKNLVPGLVEVGGMHLDHTKQSLPEVSTKLLKYLLN